jgi:hypothetical protein
MKPINFINPISPTTHRSLAQFIRITLIITLCLCVVLGTISLYQLHHLTTLKQDVASLTMHCERFKQRLEKQEELAKTEQELRDKLNTSIALHKKQKQLHYKLSLFMLVT